MARVIGIDPGIVTIDLYGLDAGRPFLDRSFPTATALADPAHHAAIVLAFDGDDIDRAVKDHPAGLRAIQRFDAPGQDFGTVYVSGTPPISKAVER